MSVNNLHEFLFSRVNQLLEKEVTAKVCKKYGIISHPCKYYEQLKLISGKYFKFKKLKV